MSERLEKWHIETSPEVSDDEIRRAVAVLNLDLREPNISPRRKEEINRRIGHLVFEYHFRQSVDMKASA